MGINKPYSKLQSVEMPQSVSALFSVRLVRAQKRARRIESLKYGIYATISVAASVVSAAYVSSALSQAGAYQFLSLVFSDTAALSYSREIFLAVVESLPVLAMAVFMGALLVSGIILPRFVRSQSSTLYA